MAHEQILSRRKALAVSTGGVITLLAACSGGSSKSPSTQGGASAGPDAFKKLPGAERLRAESKYLQPSSYVKTYKVDASGKDGAFKSLKDCYAAILADKQKRLGVSAASPQSNPWDWRKVEIAPGTYHEMVSGTPPHVALIGMGSRPEETHFITSGTVDTIDTTGRSTFVSNMMLEQNDKNPDSHPFREEGQSGDVGLGPLQRRTIVFEKVKFVAGGGGAWGKTAADIMPGPGTAMVFKDCTFTADGQQQQVNVVTNSHPTPAASQFFFLGCTVSGNQSRAGNSNSTESFPVGAPDFSAGHNDTFVWMDGHWSLGSAVHVAALLAFPSTLDPTNSAVTKKNPTTQYVVINPGEVAGAQPTSPDGVKPVLSEVPAGLSLPLYCLSDEERDFFGSKPSSAEERIVPSAPQAGTMKVKAGEVYWVTVPHADKAICSQAVELNGVQLGFAATTLTLGQSGKPMSDGNALTSGTGAKSGRVAVSPRWFYPGQGPVWVGLSFSADAEVPAMKAQSGGAFTGSSASGAPMPTGLQPIAAGTLVPRPTVVSAWNSSNS